MKLVMVRYEYRLKCSVFVIKREGNRGDFCVFLAFNRTKDQVIESKSKKNGTQTK
jgi:hypothetical protein